MYPDVHTSMHHRDPDWYNLLRPKILFSKKLIPGSPWPRVNLAITVYNVC